MTSFNRQLQTKLTERQYRLVELRANERGVTPSELLRELVERECGRPTRITLAEQLAIELVLEVRELLLCFFAEFTKADPADVEAATFRIPGHARAEADRRIREAADRERTK